MLTTLLIRLLAPLILEVIKELLEQIASGKSVQLNESAVKLSLDKRKNVIDRSLKTAMAGVGVHYEG